MILDSIRNSLFGEVINGQMPTAGGLLPHEEDERDFKYEDLGGIFDYKPKHEIHEIPTRFVKNQGSLNTCVWNSFAVAAEACEDVELSPRSMVKYAVQNGFIRGNGYSTLREGQEVGRKFGIAEEKVDPNHLMDWDSYAHGALSLPTIESAEQHKSKSYFSVTSKNEFLKALDDGHVIHTGFNWYSSYNMSGGLRAPWILSWGKGYKVAGHAVACVGYNTKLQLLKFKNSFGPDYGDNGCFYVRFADWFRAPGLPGFVRVDLDTNQLAEFLKNYEGKDVKSTNDPAIYRIQGGVRRPYPNENTFYAWGGRFGAEQDRNFVEISGALLNQAPIGAPMTAEESPYWPKLKGEWANIQWMRHPENLDHIIKLIK